MKMDTGLLLWGLLFSSIGLGYFIYGKRQQAPTRDGAAAPVSPAR